MTDLISDFLIRIKNASMANRHRITCPYSTFLGKIADVIAKEGIIAGYEVVQAGQFKQLMVNLKSADGIRTNQIEVRLVTKPGRRVYVQTNRLDRYLLGRLTAIISTPRGLMTVKQAKKDRLGGELICYIGFK